MEGNQPRDTVVIRRPAAYPDDTAGEALTFAELDARVVSVGSVLFVLANLFYFSGWFFAFFFLRSLNTNNAWQPSGITHPNRQYGAVMVALIVLSAIAFYFASRTSSWRSPLWLLLAPVSWVLGMAGVLFGVYQLWHLGFGMTDGGYASVYVGFVGSIIGEATFLMFWLLTILFQSVPAGDTALRPFSRIAFGRILYFVALVSVLAYFTLYFAA